MPGKPSTEAKSGGKDPTGITAADLAILSSILVLLISFYIVLPGAPSYFGDDIAYDGGAHSLLNGAFTLNGNPFGIESSMIMPISVLYYLFGYSYRVGILWDEISLLLAVLFTFLLVRRLYGAKAASISALLLGIFPVLQPLSTTAGNDPVVVLLVTLSILCAMYGLRKNSGLFLFVSGASTAAAPFASPLAAVASLFVIIYALYSTLKTKNLNMLKWFVFGMVVIILLNCVYDWVLSGKPLIFATMLTHFAYVFGPGNLKAEESFPYSQYLTEAFGFVNQNWSLQFPGFNISGYGLFFYAAVISAIYLLIKKRKRSYVLICMLAFSFLYLQFGPMYVSFFPFTYLYVFRSFRFLTLLSAPAAIITGIALADLLDSRRKILSALAIAVLIVLFANGAYIDVIWHYSVYSSTYSQIAIADYLLSLNKNISVYSTYGAINIEIYDGFSKRVQLNAYSDLNCSILAPGSYVVLQPYNHDNISTLKCHYPITPVLSPYISEYYYNRSLVDNGYYPTFYSELFYYGNSSPG